MHITVSHRRSVLSCGSFGISHLFYLQTFCIGALKYNEMLLCCPPFICIPTTVHSLVETVCLSCCVWFTCVLAITNSSRQGMSWKQNGVISHCHRIHSHQTNNVCHCLEENYHNAFGMSLYCQSWENMLSTLRQNECITEREKEYHWNIQSFSSYQCVPSCQSASPCAATVQTIHTFEQLATQMIRMFSTK